jgi:hypothetical protein
MHMPDDKSQGIVRTGRGEEQPADKDRAQTAAKTEPGHLAKQPVIREKLPQGQMSDFTDDRAEAHDPVSKDGPSQPRLAKEKTSPHQKEQWGADVRPDPLPSTLVLPERLIRPSTSHSIPGPDEGPQTNA